jgi:hypothetical protein
VRSPPIPHSSLSLSATRWAGSPLDECRGKLCPSARERDPAYLGERGRPTPGPAPAVTGPPTTLRGCFRESDDRIYLLSNFSLYFAKRLAFSLRRDRHNSCAELKMCHHLVVGLADGLDMYYGTRQQWFDPVIAAQPQGFCRVAARANPAMKIMLAEREATVARLRLHIRHEAARAVEEHRLIADGGFGYSPSWTGSWRRGRGSGSKGRFRLFTVRLFRKHRPRTLGNPRLLRRMSSFVAR